VRDRVFDLGVILAQALGHLVDIGDARHDIGYSLASSTAGHN
jgi:hypothetical protein